MKIKRYIIFFVITLVFTQCTKTNWYENYREKEKSPFGTYILYNEASTLFNKQEVELLNENIYDYLATNFRDKESEDFGNYVCIKFSADKLTQMGVQDLLDFVYEGNDAFIALNHYTYILQDALDFDTDNEDNQVFAPANLKELKGKLLLKNDKFETQEYEFDRNLRRHYFTRFNEQKTQVLGTLEIFGVEKPVFIKIYHGKGAVYLHTQPIAFTNYNLLKDNYTYAENVFSYLPDRKVLWDPQIHRSKLSENYNNDEGRESVFSFFMQNPSLKWSLYIFLLSLLLFMLFNARRKQRAIPVITELKNSTVEFTHTIANLYFKENDHKDVIDKKIKYFLERVKRIYLIETTNLNETFIEILASKSGNSLDATNYLIKTIIDLNKKDMCTQHELYRLNTLIDNFFNPNINGADK